MSIRLSYTNIIRKILIPLTLFCLMTSCTSVDKLNTAEKSVGAGTVIGAGIGAVTGSATGSAGEGLVLGALAGAGLGAMVGNQFQEQEKSMAQQAEQIALQEKELRKQQSELDELRQVTQDRISYKKPSRNNYFERSKSDTQFKSDKIIQEKDIVTNKAVSVPDQKVADARASYRWQPPKQTKKIVPKPEPVAKRVIPARPAKSAECQQATDEAEKASSSGIIAEKLYHFRRALRICPDDAEIHTGLSRVYIELDRKDDARFELEEALRLDPAYAPAKKLYDQLS